jgi:3-oxoacyl-[acyl-carrier protein] reductase
MDIRAATGSDIVGVVADLTTRNGVTYAVQTAIDHCGQVDIAVSNVYGPISQGFDSVSESQWIEAFQQQVMHVVYLTAAVVPGMKERRWGRLINIGSICAKEPHRELPLITANVVRPAVVGLQKSLAAELAPFGITVNNVLPSGVATERMLTYQRARARELIIAPEEISEMFKRRNPMKRLADPREIGAIVVFLASEQASYITGVSIQVDGGAVRSLF